MFLTQGKGLGPWTPVVFMCIRHKRSKKGGSTCQAINNTSGPCANHNSSCWSVFHFQKRHIRSRRTMNVFHTIRPVGKKRHKGLTHSFNPIHATFVHIDRRITISTPQNFSRVEVHVRIFDVFSEWVLRNLPFNNCTHV